MGFAGWAEKSHVKRHIPPRKSFLLLFSLNTNKMSCLFFALPRVDSNSGHIPHTVKQTTPQEPSRKTAKLPAFFRDLDRFFG